MQRIRINVLGHFGVVGATPTHVGGRTQRLQNATMALAALALRDEYPYPAFIAALWPGETWGHWDDQVQKRLAARLYRAVYQAGQLLGENAKHRVHCDRWTERVRLTRGLHEESATVISSDFDEFTALWGSTARAQMLTAVELVRGRIGDGVPCNPYQADWLAPQQENLEERVADLLQRLFGHLHELDDVLRSVFDLGGHQALELHGLLKWRSAQRSGLRGFSEFSWEELGVTPAAVGPPFPERLARASDTWIDAALADALVASREADADANIARRFVLVRGTSNSGKTRALSDGVRRYPRLAALPTVAPDPLDVEAQLEALAIAETSSQALILWLDDVDGTLGHPSAHISGSAARLRAALKSNPSLLVFATAGGKGGQRGAAAQGREAWSRAMIDLEGMGRALPPLPSSPDINDVLEAEAAAWDPELVLAIKRFGLGPALSAGPELVRTLELARDSDERPGWALVSIVGVLQREGWYPNGVPVEVARAAWRGILDLPPDAVNADNWARAVSFATSAVRGAARFLTIDTEELYVHDYVAIRALVTGLERARAQDALMAGITEQNAPQLLPHANDVFGVRVAFAHARYGNSQGLAELCDHIDSLDAWPREPCFEDAVINLTAESIANNPLQLGSLSGLRYWCLHATAATFHRLCDRICSVAPASGESACCMLRAMRNEPTSEDLEALQAAATNYREPLFSMVCSYRYQEEHIEADFDAVLCGGTTAEAARQRMIAHGRARGDEGVLWSAVWNYIDSIRRTSDGEPRQFYLHEAAKTSSDALSEIVELALKEFESISAACGSKPEMRKRLELQLHGPRQRNEALRFLWRLVATGGGDSAGWAADTLLLEDEVRADPNQVAKLLRCLPIASTLEMLFWEGPLDDWAKDYAYEESQRGNVHAAACLYVMGDESTRHYAEEAMRRGLNNAEPYGVLEVAMFLSSYTATKAAETYAPLAAYTACFGSCLQLAVGLGYQDSRYVPLARAALKDALDGGRWLSEDLMADAEHFLGKAYLADLCRRLASATDALHQAVLEWAGTLHRALPVDQSCDT
jgi:hypothetical protein